MDNFFGKAKRRHVRELNIVPILDMMTTLIIFLLQITSFMEFTKITVPPSSTVTITDPLRPPPVAPKIFLMRPEPGRALRLQLMWSGENPGERNTLIEADKLASIEESGPVIFNEVKKISEELKKQFPTEKTIQIGASSNVPYQFLISTMDGIQEAFVPSVSNSTNTEIGASPANLVLVSYRDVDAEQRGSGAESSRKQSPDKKGASL